jgi:hypothetical protein
VAEYLAKELAENNNVLISEVESKQEQILYNTYLNQHKT